LLRTAYTKGRNRRVATRLHTVYTIIRARHRAKVEVYDIAILIILCACLLFLLAAFQGEGLLNLPVVGLKVVEGKGAGPVIKIDK
jgi:hypothetical protein